MNGQVVECVPNFSEGRDARRVEAIVAAMRVEGVSLLDWSMDADHNRSVVTVAGEPAAVVEAAVRGVGKAADLIDLTRQQGAHPRMGEQPVHNGIFHVYGGERVRISAERGPGGIRGERPLVSRHAGARFRHRNHRSYSRWAARAGLARSGPQPRTRPGWCGLV